SGVLIGSGQNNVVAGNLIGTDVTGQAVLGNQIGVWVRSQSNQIGGGGNPSDETGGNVISGNRIDGILLSGDQNTVLGNLIGTNAMGKAGSGVWVDNGASELTGNLIAANGEGIRIDGDNNQVTSNLVGTDITGRRPLGNGILGPVGQENRFAQIVLVSTRPVLV